METENAITSDSASLSPITLFKGGHGFLSNFYPCRVRYTLFVYSSVEHAYQAAKAKHSDDAARIRAAASAWEAKRLGSELRTMGRVRPDWHDIKLEVMGDLLWQKFVLNSELRTRLLATGDRQLIEGNTWGDTFWGKCGETGSNHLGNLLMGLRTIARYIDQNQPKKTEGSYGDGRQPADDGG